MREVRCKLSVRLSTLTCTASCTALNHPAGTVYVRGTSPLRRT